MAGQHQRAEAEDGRQGCDQNTATGAVAESVLFAVAVGQIVVQDVDAIVGTEPEK